MPDDPFEPSPPDYSMHLPEIIPPVKYKNFKDLHYDDKLEILTDEMVVRETGTPVEVMLRNLGISEKEYKTIIANDKYLKLIKDKSLRMNFAPHVPAIFESLGFDAANGEAAAQKSALQLMGSIIPENTTLINQNLITMTDDELKLETEKLMRSLGGKNNS